MTKRTFTKPDGRRIHLYADGMLPDSFDIPEPNGGRVEARPQLRWHPFRAEWVDYASHRQERTFLPPEGYDPLAPTRPGQEPTELPPGPWEVAAFENRFPSLVPSPPAPPPNIVETRPAVGVCEVVVYTQDATGGIGDLDARRVELLMDVWADRTEELGARDSIQYVMPFENRGIEVGATLAHPHGQIYAYSFVPPIAAVELEEQRRHLELHGRGLLESILEAERRDGRRMLYEGDHAVAFVPAFARYPYEVWIAPREPRPTLPSLRAEERADFARALRETVQRYDRVQDRPFPYVMVFHQAPTDGAGHPEAHVHAEFYPAFRKPGRLKYLAGTEIGAGMFTNDALPEAKAEELRAIDLAPAHARR